MTRSIACSWNEKHSNFKDVRPEKGIEVHDTLTRLEYKEDNETFLKRKVRLCARGDQQVEGERFTPSWHRESR